MLNKSNFFWSLRVAIFCSSWAPPASGPWGGTLSQKHRLFRLGKRWGYCVLGRVGPSLSPAVLLEKTMPCICPHGDGTASVFMSATEELMRAVGPGSLPAPLPQGTGMPRQRTSDLNIGEVSPLCLVKAVCQGQRPLDGLLG